MARPGSEGLTYFPLDVTLDEKFGLIEAEYGVTGFAVVVKLYQKVYKQGCYCEWTKEVALLFSKDNCLGGNVVSEIVEASIRRGIFDSDLFKKYSILTSRGIQERYFEIAKRRKQVKIDKRYLLLSADILPNNVYIISEDVDINAENVDRNPIKESKVKYISCCDSPEGERNERTDFEKKALAAAEYMAKKILKHTPNFPHLKEKKREKTIEGWAEHIERLLRIDGVDFDEFKQVLKFSQTDPFWQKNILSGQKLREQYGQLLVKMQGDDYG